MKNFTLPTTTALRKYLALIVLLLTVNVGWGQTNIVKFDFSTLAGGANTFGASPLTPTTSDANVTIVGLTRGSGMTTTGTAAAKAWGGLSGNTSSTQATGISSNNTATFSIMPNAGYKVSLTQIPAYNIRCSNTGYATGIWQYSVNGGTYTDIGTAITWGATTSSAGNAQSAITLSGISALQNVTTSISLRVVLWSSSSTGGSWYFNDQISGTNDLIVTGTTSATGYSTNAAGDWNTAATWVGNSVPPAGATCNVNHAVTLAASLNNTGVINVNSGGSLQLNAGGYVSGTPIVYAATGSGLIFNNSSSYGISSGQAFWPTTSPPYNVTISGSGATTNMTVGAIAGTLTLNSALTISTASQVTVNGNLQMNSGGSVVTNVPVYGAASTLIYNTSKTTSNEWTGGAAASVAAGSGIPANVTVQSGTVTLAGGRGVPGNITVNSSCGMILNSSTGDLYIGGNLINNGSTWTNNSRAVFFVGTGTSVITNSSGTQFFDYFVNQKTAGSVQLATSTNVTLNTTTGSVLQFLNAGTLDLNGNTLTLNNSGGNILVDGTLGGVAKSITSSSAATIAITNSKTASNNASGSLSIGANITVVLTGAMNFGSGVTTINGTLKINAGGSVSANAPAYGSGSLLLYNSNTTYGRGTEWTASSGTIGTTAGYPYNVQISNTTVLNVPNGVTQPALGVANNLTVDALSSFYQDYANPTTSNAIVVGGSVLNNGSISLGNNVNGDLKLAGNFTQNGTFTPNGRALFFTGAAGTTQLIAASSSPVTIPYIILGSTGNTVKLSNTSILATAINGGNAIDFGSSASNVFDLNAYNVTIGTTGQTCNFTGSGFFKGNASSTMTIQGTTCTGNVGFVTTQQLSSLTVNLSSGGITLSSPLTAATLAMTAGSLSMNGNAVTVSSILSGSGTIKNNHASTAATLTVSAASGNNTFAGSLINGAAATLALTNSGSGTLTLSGANTYTGATANTSSGTISISSTNTSAITNSSTAKLAGTGSTSGAVNIASGTFISPASSGSYGTLTTGPLTLNGTYTFDISSLPTGTAGTNWDYISCSTLTTTGFALIVSGTMPSFSASTSYQWKIGAYSSTLSASGTYTVSTAGVTGITPTGTFTVTISGGFIYLNYTCPTLTLSSQAASATSLVQNKTGNNIYTLLAASSGAANTVTAISFNGTYTATTDFTNFKLYYNTTGTFNTTTLLGTVTTIPASGNAITFSGLTQSIAAGTTGYFYLSTDIPCAAVVSDACTINAITTSNVTTTANLLGTPSSGSALAVAAPAAPANATSLAASTASGQSVITWTAPVAPYCEVMLIANTVSTIASPSGNGSAYTANSQAFTDGLNTTFSTTGKVVYKGSAATATITGLTNGTVYYFKLFTRNGNTWSAGTEVSVTPNIIYCTPDNLDCSVSDYISNVTFNTLNNTTTCGTTTTGYTTYAATGTQTTTVIAGSSYNITVSSGSGSGTHGASVWIDFNNNGLFTDAGEYFLISNSISPSTTTTPVSISIPSGAFIGSVRMRIRYIYSTTLASTMSCISGGAYGETEDYTINVTAPCTQPTTQATIGSYTANTTGTSLTVNWTRGNGTGGVIVVANATATATVNPSSGTTYTPSTTGDFGGTTITGTGNIVVYNGTGTSVNVTGLTSGTNYTFSVYEYNSASTCYLTPAANSSIVACTTGTPSVSIAVTTGSNPTCASGSVTFTATPTNGGTPTYQWLLNGTNVGTSSTTYTNTTLVNGDQITCVMTNTAACGTQTATSNAVTITVNAAPSTSVAGSNQSICSNATATLAANTPSVGTGAWSVTGPSTLLSQFSNTASPTAVFTPVGGAGTYTLTWTISNGACTASTSNVIITVNAAPSAVTISPNATVCQNTITTLTASSVFSGTYAIGTATSTSAAATTPYRITSTSTARMQYLVTKAELNSAGITGSQNISSLGFNVTAVGSAGSITSYVINMANTSTIGLTTTYQSPTFTQVYSSSYTVVSGINTHTFSTPFAWDGTSNVLINICMAGPSLTTNPSVDALTTSFTGTTTNSNNAACSNSTSAVVAVIRPIIYFGTSSSSSITWATNTTGLWTDSTANTTAYTNQIAGTVYANPSTTQTYTATATATNTCTTSATSTLTVNPQPQGSLTANGPFCTTGDGQLTWTATAGIGPYTVVYNDGTANRTATGVVSGTPFAVFTTPVTSTTTYTLVSVTDSSTTTCARTTGFTGSSATITINPVHTISLTSGSSTQLLCINTALVTNIVYTFNGGATGAGVSGLPSGMSGAVSGSTFTISGTPTASGTFNYTVTTSGNGCTVATATGTITVSNVIGFANLQYPASGTICMGGTYTAYGQVYQVGVTPAVGQGSGITVQFGFNGTNTDPSTWSTWAAATYSIDAGNNDEYLYTFTPASSGTFYYTFRYKSGSCDWQYGGYNSGFWNGTTNVNGALTVNSNAAHTITLSSGTGTTTQSFCANTALPTSITYTVGGGATGAGVTGLPSGMSGSYSGGTFTISGTPTASGTFIYTVTTSGNGCASAVTTTGTLTISSAIDFANLQYPPSGTICPGGLYTAYGQVYEPGVTNSLGQGTGITVQFGFNGTNTDPSTWTTWAAATYNTDSGNNDEYTYGFTTSTSGTFYYTFRYKQGTCNWQYGGYSSNGGGFWNGTSNINGVLTVNPNHTLALTGGSATPTMCINTALGTNIVYTVGGGATGAGVTGLPSGMNGNFSGSTFTLSGTPTVSGTFNYTVTTTGNSCTIATATGTITVTPANTASAASTTPTLCISTALTAITHTTTGATGIGTATGLPEGVTAAWANDTITISGTPTASGTFSYSIPLTGGCGSVSATGTITVTSTNTASAASTTPTLCISTALTAITHTTTGAIGIGTATGLPAGVTATWANDTITISGTPTASGAFNYSIPLTGGCGSVSATGTITVTSANTASAASITPTLCINTALTAITHTTTGATGIGTATGLPAGVTAAWANDTITISGTPTASGTFSYSIPLTGGCGTVSAIGTITVNPSLPASVSIAALPNGAICAGTSVTFTATPTNDGTPTYQWNVNGTAVSGQTSSMFTTAALSNTDVVTVVMTSTASPCLTGSPATSNEITMTVNPVSNANLTTATPQTQCVGGTFTPLSITATGTSPITYQWYSNTAPSNSGGVSLGADAQTSSYTPLATTAGVLYYYCVVSSSCGSAVPSAISGSITVNPSPTASIVNSNNLICPGSDAVFNLTGTSGATVTYKINGGANATTTLTSGAAAITVTNPTSDQTLTLVSVASNGCTTTLSATYTIGSITTTYNGSAWDNGDPNSYKTVVFNSDYTITSDFFACSIRVAAGATVTVNSGLNVHINGAITVDPATVTPVVPAGNFILNNNTNLLQANDLAENTGNITVKRNTSTILRLDHTLWSSPVVGQQLFSFSPATLTNRFYSFNTATNAYTNNTTSSIIFTSNSVFSPTVGYAIRAPNDQSSTVSSEWTGTFKGVPNNGTKTFSLVYNGSGNHSYNLVGNPFPSTINASLFTEGNTDSIDGTLYFYQHTLSMNAAGIFPDGTNYACWNFSGSAGATAGSNTHTINVDPNGFIQVGQGFFVDAKSSNNLSFTNAMREGNVNNQFMKTTNTTERHRMWLNLITDTGVDINQILVGYIAGATQGFDSKYDGLLFGNTGSYLYSTINGSPYVIQGRALPFNTSDEVPLGFNCDVAGTFSIKLSNMDGLFSGNQEVFIRDNLTGTDTNIKTAPYTFTSDAGTYEDRFKIVYTQALGVPSNTFNDNSVIVYKNTDWFHVSTKGIVIKDIMVYDVSGRLIYKLNDVNDTTSVLKGLSQTKQVLFVKVISQENQSVTIKVIN